MKKLIKSGFVPPNLKKIIIMNYRGTGGLVGSASACYDSSLGSKIS